jgi:GST-like protein
MYQLYGKTNSGAAAIEAAVELCDVPYRFIDVEASAEAAQALEKLNPLQQIPTLQTPSGDVLTESAAILIHLGLTFPAARLLPSDARERDQAIRGMTYIVTNCYAAIGIVDYPEHVCTGAGRCLPISFPASCTWGSRNRGRWMCWQRW